MMRKMLCLSLALALLVPATGCEKSSDPKPKTSTSSEVKTTPKKTDFQYVTPTKENFDPTDYLDIEFKYKPYGACALTVFNRSDKMMWILLQITAKDESGAIIATDSVIVDNIFPNRHTFKAYNSPINEESASIDYKISECHIEDIPYWYNDNFLEPTVDNISIRDGDTGDANSKITGEIRNDNDFDIPRQTVYLVIYNENNVIEPQDFAYLTYTDKIKAHSSEPFQINTFLDLSQENYQVLVALNAN